jgi:hypothetical protein
VILLGKLREEQGSHGLCRKWSVNLMNEGSGIMSTMKEEARTTVDNKLKESQRRLKEYLESICDDIMRFQRTRYDDLMCMKAK